MRILRLLPLLLLASCVIGADKYPRPIDLAPTWLVDRPRVLAVQAEPPEVRPGDIATFSALVPTPGADTPYLVVWLACPVDGGGIGFGCPLDFDDLDLEDASPEELAEIGFIGAEPFLAPVYVAPSDFLDGMDERARREGAYVLVQVTAIPEDADASDDFDFNEVEAAYKRLVVSEATTPNHNPRTGPFSVNGTVIPEGTVVHLDRDQPYELAVALPDDTIEEYEYLDPNGELQVRTEEPYVAWFATDGEVAEEVTLHPYTDTDWYSPKKSGTTGFWYAVVRDRRGGQAWRVQEWVVD